MLMDDGAVTVTVAGAVFASDAVAVAVAIVLLDSY